ncbi:hypothetical protein [Vagococcus fluvialis]|uniref:hypothetical protein n=1 Tax=Vagococcus fluvialis TaxID=2738 RepID=UPI003B5CEEF4
MSRNQDVIEKMLNKQKEEHEKKKTEKKSSEKNKNRTEAKTENKAEDKIETKNDIKMLIDKQGSSLRKADSIRINPIIASALLYWTSIIDPSKSKPDIVEESLIEFIPAEYLLEGYNIAKKQKKI